VTFPRKAAHAPLYYARDTTHQPEGSPRYAPRYWDGAETPLFPFGFGLSYTTFAYANLKVAAPAIAVGAQTTVSVAVTNTGAVPGDEVVQLYIHQRTGTDTRPRRELKGFERITLAPGQTKAVSFTLGPDALRYWSAVERRVLQDAAQFDVWVGGDSTAATHAGFEVTR
jgi:beta-glucosidase